jgi:hypothetical protein
LGDAWAKSSSGRAARIPADTEKIAQRERVRCAPRDAALRIDALEIANQQQSKLDSGPVGRSAHRRGVEGGILGFGEIVEPMIDRESIPIV